MTVNLNNQTVDKYFYNFENFRPTPISSQPYLPGDSFQKPQTPQVLQIQYKENKHLSWLSKHLFVATGFIAGATGAKYFTSKKINTSQQVEDTFKKITDQIENVGDDVEKRLESSLKFLRDYVEKMAKRDKFKISHLNTLKWGIIGAAATSVGLWIYGMANK